MSSPPSSPCTAHADRLLQLETARHTVREVASALAADGIAVAPIKGALLVAVFQLDRVFADVDLLVQPRDHARAVERLRHVGYRVAAEQAFATMLLHAERPFPIDLHGECFPSGLFELRAEDVLARASLDESLYGVPVRRLDPYDVVALAVGHFAKDRLDERASARVGELIQICERAGLDAQKLAAHLASAGLGRAARHAFGLAARRGSRLAEDTLLALPADPVGRAAVFVARRWTAAFPSGSWLAAPASHLLNGTLARGGASFMLHAREAFPRRARRML